MANTGINPVIKAIPSDFVRVIGVDRTVALEPNGVSPPVIAQVNTLYILGYVLTRILVEIQEYVFWFVHMVIIAKFSHFLFVAPVRSHQPTATMLLWVRLLSDRYT
jgi:hypothetical protein